MTKRRKKWIVWTLVVLLVYVGSYVVLSRRGFRDADECGMDGGFYFLHPEPHPEDDHRADGAQLHRGEDLSRLQDRAGRAARQGPAPARSAT
ncbi:MAG: hypothetical protein HQ559_10465 [Lentisphaerae bacterium]|nr:hypothetical protein [Lentisphaerota bacterium]